MNNSEDFGYFSKTVSEQLGVSTDTLRSWSLKLESVGVEFKRNERKQRTYFEKDIRAFKNMKELLDLQQPLDEVSKIIAEKIEKGLFDKLEIENNAEIMPSVIQENNAQITLEEIKKMMMQVAATAAEEKIQAFHLEQQRSLPSPEEERLKKFNEIMLNRRIERRLQERAQQEWEKLSEAERTVKAGLFGLKRSENAEKRQNFIREYVDRHYETELLQELDIDGVQPTKR